MPLFPSPCGVMVAKVPIQQRGHAFFFFNVSVPLRGNGGERGTIKTLILNVNSVSVPLRGNGGESSEISLTTLHTAAMFPSPCGVMVAKATVCPSRSQCSAIGLRFPSPCGVMVAKDIKAIYPMVSISVSVPLRGNGGERCLRRATHQRQGKVSVPLRGNGCESHNILVRYQKRCDQSFRPLAG